MRVVAAAFFASLLVVAVVAQASEQPFDDEAAAPAPEPQLEPTEPEPEPQQQQQQLQFQELEPVPPPPRRVHELRHNQLALAHPGPNPLRRHAHHFHARRVEQKAVAEKYEAPAAQEDATEEEDQTHLEEMLRSTLRANKGCRNLHHENLKLRHEVLKLKREVRKLQKIDATEEERLHAAGEQRHELKREMEVFTRASGGAAHPRAHAGLLAHQRSLLRRRLENEESADSSVDAGNEASSDSSADTSAVNQFPIVGTMAGLYSRFTSELPSFGGVVKANEVEEMKSESKDAVHVAVMEADLEKSREDLGKAEEEKQHLQDRVSDLESTASDKDNELVKLKDALHQSEAERQELEKLQQRVNATQQDDLSKELVAEKAGAAEAKAELVAKLGQKDAATRQLSEKLRRQESEREKLVAELHQELTGEGKYAAERFETERRKEEETLKSEAKELQSMEGAEGKCMAWGKRLEVKLQHVLKNRQNDARLCRDGILSLHEERSKLKKQLQKKEAEIVASKKEQAEAEASSTEDQGLLSKCLDEIGTMHT